MQLNNRYHRVFGRIPIFGMIHLAGTNPVKRALEELAIFEEERIDGAIVENYHGYFEDAIATLQETYKRKPNMIIGVNILPNEFTRSFRLAKEYGADFIQLDHVAGRYLCGNVQLDRISGNHLTLDFKNYQKDKMKYPQLMVFGGVWPKYYQPIEGSDLETDLRTGRQRAEAIVVTGMGTGKETPLDKIVRFKEIIGTHPLIVGAGLTPDNAYEQLCMSDGAIVGSSLKVGNRTYSPIDQQKVKDFMFVVKEAREYQEKNGMSK